MGPVAAAAVTVALWASAFVAIRSAGCHFAPGTLALGPPVRGLARLGVVWLLSDSGWPTRAAWPGILGSGLLWFGLAAGMAVLFGGAVPDCTMQSMMIICIHDRAHHPRRARRRRPHDEDSRGSVRPVLAGLPPQLD